MIDYKKRSLQKELLDEKEIPFRDIFLNMKELDYINSHLGGHSITIKGFRKLYKSARNVVVNPPLEQKNISICEIGCGGGDNLNALYRYSLKKKINCLFTGIDLNQDCIAFAKDNTTLPNARFIVSDYRNVDFEKNKPDIIFSSLFCHHFSDDELVEMLKWMQHNSTTGFFINDLHRHPVAYHFIKTVTHFFSHSYLVKNDAPVSVLRGFKKSEWENIFKKAGIENYSITWKWAFRDLIIAFNTQNKMPAN